MADLQEVRRSQIAYAVIRLCVSGRNCVLLRRHSKWGDYSLVGGHVEPDEVGDWARAATRECNEELEPLLADVDFTVVALPGPKQWGPVPSRSQKGQPTIYEARWFTLRFIKDPVECLNRLEAGEFLLVDEEQALSGSPGVTELLRRYAESVTGGFAGVPFSWAGALDAERLLVPVANHSTSAARTP